VGLKRAVNLKTGKLTGLKSHELHILMERIIPVMFRGYMPDAMWQAIAELSYFYRQICAKEISKNMMEKLEKEISVLLCKLEKICPPRLFNPMEHVLIHIPYEAKVCGPVQYRWMYHIGRALKNLRAMVRNKARVEGCITEAFLQRRFHTSRVCISQRNKMSMLLRYDTMSMRNLLSVISKISNGEAQILVRARSTTLAWMKECPYCYTCTRIWKRWTHISCKSLF
jgi:hypothetical protein